MILPGLMHSPLETAPVSATRSVLAGAVADRVTVGVGHRSPRRGRSSRRGRPAGGGLRRIGVDEISYV
jgi:hypothetical protein